jgi:hypothetical protein
VKIVPRWKNAKSLLSAPKIHPKNKTPQMKLTKFILSASLLSVAFAGMASAQVVIRITGSSAYRAAVTNAVGQILNSPTAAYVGSSLSGGSQQLFIGTLKTATGSYAAGTAVDVVTSWTGSLSGLIALTSGSSVASPGFLSTTANATSSMTVGTGATATSTSSGGTALTSPVYDSNSANQKANFAFSDVFQSSTAYATPALATANTGGDLAGIVGVVPFVFVSNPDTSTSITNINSIQAQQLFDGGLAGSQLDGNDSDTNFYFPVGRDADSGTRFTTFAETGFNTVGGATTEPVQYQVVKSGSTVTVSLYPADTLFGTTYPAGTQGYPSGGNEEAALIIAGTSTASGTPGYAIGYLGESDSTNAVKAGCHFLSYNGVSYGSISGSTVTFNRALIDSGVYTLWGYEHAYYDTGASVGPIADQIAANVYSTDAIVAGELISNMYVSRGEEGGPIQYVGNGQ